MLCLCLNTRIIGENVYSMLSILNDITLQKELQNFLQTNAFWATKVKRHQQDRLANIKTLVRAGN